MKKLYLLLICAFFCIPAFSQVVEMRNGVKCVSNIIPSRDGKFNYVQSLTRNADATWRGVQPQWSQTAEKKPNSVRIPRAPVITHHVVFHIEQMGGTFALIKGDTSFMTFWNLDWTSDGVEGDIVDGYYFLLSEHWRSYSSYDTILYVVQSGFHVYRDMDTTILSSTANHNINLILYDRFGTPLKGKHHTGDNFGIDFQFPDTCFTPSFNMSYNGFAGPYIRLSDVEPDINITMSKTNVPWAEPYRDYIVTYPDIIGIDKDTTMSFDPNEYNIYSFCLQPTPAFDPGDTTYFQWGFGSFDNDSLTGRVDSFIGAWVGLEYPGNGRDSMYLYIAGTTSVSAVRNFGYLVAHDDIDPYDYSYCGLFGPFFYLDQNNQLILSSLGNFPPVAGDYRVHKGNWVDFGTTAPFHYLRSYNEPGMNTIDTYHTFKDQTGSRRDIDLMKTTYEVWEGNTKVFYDSLGGFRIYYWSPGPDVYTVIVHDSNYNILDKPGYLESNFTMDLGSPDPNPPALISLKIKRCDSLQPELLHGFVSALEFTAGDFNTKPPDYERKYSTLADVFVMYKEYSDTLWNYLDVISQPWLLDSLCGMPYRTDLAPVLNHFPDSAWVDLRIELIDSAGNYSIQTMHPAFLVRDPGVSVKNHDQQHPVSIYPNPVTDILRISTTENWTGITIYTSSGQVVLDVPFADKINTANLREGLYLMRLTNATTNEMTFVKFIK